MQPVVAIIQARMGSTRLPGKALRLLRGRPVLWHVLHRLQKCARLERIVVATTTQPEDDLLESFALEQGATVVRGPAQDVLRRYGMAARATRAGTIVSVTGHAPLIDPATIDRWIAAVTESGAEMVLSRPARAMIHEGVDVFSRSALDRLSRTAPGDPLAREHVSAWFHRHPGFLTVVEADADPRHFFRGARLSVDTPADLEFLETVHERLAAAAGEVDVAELVRLLQAEPELLAINAHVRREDPAAPSRRVLIHCAQPHALELSLGLAAALRDGLGIAVVLAVAKHLAGVTLPFPCELEPREASEEAWLRELCRRMHPDALVLVDESVPRASRFASLIAHWGAGDASGADLDLAVDDPTEAAVRLGLAFGMAA